MRSARSILTPLLTAILSAAAVFIYQSAAWAQEETPLGPLPGQPVEHPETPLWLTLMALAVALGALGLVVLIGASYLFLSRRFFSKEEPPPPRRPAIRVPPGAGVPPPARAMGHPVSETTPQGAGATGTEVAPGGTATATAERPAEAGAGEKKEQPPETAETEQQPAPARHSGPAELDQETFDRVRQEQLDKGASPKVAEGRAKAAAVKAARDKAGAG